MKGELRSQAIILKAVIWKEIHKIVHILTPDMGIIQAFVYGAVKTRGGLRNAAVAMTRGQALLHYNSAKKVYTLKEMTDCRFFPSGIQQLEGFYQMSLWLEIILKTEAAGQMQEAFSLLNEFLELADKKRIITLQPSIQFIWRFLKICGESPLEQKCQACGKSLINIDFSCFSSALHEFFCPDCAENHDELLFLNTSQRSYLNSSLVRQADKAMSVDLDKADLRRLADISFYLIEALSGRKFKSLDLIRQLYSERT